MTFRSWRVLHGPAAMLAALLFLLTPQISFAQWEDEGVFGEEEFGAEDDIDDEGLADPMGDYYDDVDGDLYEDYGSYYEDEGIFGEEDD